MVKVKGGFTVDSLTERPGVPAGFTGRCSSGKATLTYFEGKDLEFKVIKLDRKRNNVVVSRRAVVEAEFSAEREAAA